MSEAKQKSSSTKWLLGCGVGCGVIVLIGVIVCVGAGFFGYKWVMAKVDTWTAEFVEQGYEKVVGQMLVVDAPLEKPTVYVAQSVTINADQTVPVAVIAQICEINATMEEKVSFRGQIVIVKAGAQVKDLDVECQIVQIDGEVTGEVTGEYQTLQR